MSVFAWVSIAFFVVSVLFFCKKPLFFLLKLFANGCVGLAVIFAANSFLPGTAAGVNPFTASVSALLGLPGAVLICLLNRII